jgi:hypothetical protein
VTIINASRLPTARTGRLLLDQEILSRGDRPFEWVLAGHGGSIRLLAEEMRARLRALVKRMKA